LEKREPEEEEEELQNIPPLCNTLEARDPITHCEAQGNVVTSTEDKT
jgi:hypothetical protein